jgi:hypothetical protein
MVRITVCRRGLHDGEFLYSVYAGTAYRKTICMQCEHPDRVKDKVVINVHSERMYRDYSIHVSVAYA